LIIFHYFFMASSSQQSAEQQLGLLGTFGIDGQLLVFNVIAFLIVIFLLKKYVFGAVLRIVDERQSIINAGVAQQEESAQVLQQAKKDAADLLAQTHRTASDILTKAEQDELALREKKKGETETIVTSMIEKGEAEVGQMKLQAHEQIRAHATEVVVAATRKIIEKDTDPRAIIHDLDTKLPL
jgi:F-type H+-transporting ATPase subunit b